eukprot:NODE_2995_length_1299_cov_101.209184_g2843_i0.p1 GENE.NODE_2995_length_1299_cov_101.209184_g2843_i0~~NODE_2995_length_1299_cov_101.209184_g2843_i0.p1  ORF type:complete len:359 (+),score=121.88 NODE_2995_length_1299_cov_101.209184_g2843_i0:61-1077(+)
MIKALCLLLLVVVQCVAGVNINMYNGGPAGSAGCDKESSGSSSSSGSNMDDKCGGHLHFYQEDWTPYSDWDVATGESNGVAIDVARAVCAAQGVTCTFSRDQWSKIWAVEEHCAGTSHTQCTTVESPGHGMAEGTYDFALAWKKTVRMASLGYTNPVFGPVPHVFVAKKKTPKATMHPDGLNDIIAVQCGWGDITWIANEFELAKVLKNEGECVDGPEALLNKVFHGQATVAAFTKTNWEQIATQAVEASVATSGKNSDYFETMVDTNGKAEWALPPEVAFMTSKRNICKTKLFNEGLKKIGSQLSSICGTSDGQKARCCSSAGVNCPMGNNGFNGNV